MHRVILLSGLLGGLFATDAAQAQGPAAEQVYVRRGSATATNILAFYDTGTRTCNSGQKQDAGHHARIVYSRAHDASTYVVALTHNSRGTGMGDVNRYYCILTSDFETFFRPQRGPEVGLVTVPFKLRADPFKIMAGNTIGPFVGKRFDHANRTSSTIMTFASLTNVPLNDLNADVPETKWGLGIGGGYVWTVLSNFQIGVITGVDLFEGVDEWVYGYQPWLSLSIGFSFLRPTTDPAALANVR